MRLRRSLILAGLTLSLLLPSPAHASNLVLDGVPEVPERVAARLQQYQNVRAARFVDWDAKGGVLIETRFGETRQVHHVAMPGGARRQVTFFTEPVNGRQSYPGRDRHGFLFTMDTGGGEFYQIYFFDQTTGQSTLLTDGKSRNTGPLWSRDGQWIAYSSNLRNGQDTDVRLMSLDKPGVSEPLFEGQGAWWPLDWSRDGQQLLVQKYVSANESYLYSFDRRTKQLRPINHTAGTRVAYGSAVFTPDGKGVYYVADDLGEFKRLYRWDLATGKKQKVSAGDEWDIVDVELSPDGKRLAYVANEDGIGRLYVLDLVTGKPVSLPAVPVGELGGIRFSPDSRQLAFSLGTAQSPGDVYTLSLADKKLTRWTQSEVGGMDTSRFVPARLIHFPSFDDRRIPAFVHKPAKATGKSPVLLLIHGGPEGQARPGFSSVVQYLVNELGIAVIEPNVRGSTGYGKTYLALDNGFQREDSVKDIGALLDWIAKQPDLDAGRVGVMGGSYGGYMTLASLTHYNDRLRAGLSNVGISNFVTFLENTQSYRRDLRRVEYGDERDPAMRTFLQRISPTTNAHKITKPLFVAQGLNDPRVPASEAEQIVKTVRDNGGLVWYFLAKDEGHGFQKKTNRDAYSRAMVWFWEQHLLGAN